MATSYPADPAASRDRRFKYVCARRGPASGIGQARRDSAPRPLPHQAGNAGPGHRSGDRRHPLDRPLCRSGPVVSRPVHGAPGIERAVSDAFPSIGAIGLKGGRCERRRPPGPAASFFIVPAFHKGRLRTVEYALRHPGSCGTIVVFGGGCLMGPPRNGLASGRRQDAAGSTGIPHRKLDMDEWIQRNALVRPAQVLANLGSRSGDARLSFPAAYRW